MTGLDTDTIKYRDRSTAEVNLNVRSFTVVGLTEEGTLILIKEREYNMVNGYTK